MGVDQLSTGGGGLSLGGDNSNPTGLGSIATSNDSFTTTQSGRIQTNE